MTDFSIIKTRSAEKLDAFPRSSHPSPRRRPYSSAKTLMRKIDPQTPKVEYYLRTLSGEWISYQSRFGFHVTEHAIAGLRRIEPDIALQTEIEALLGVETVWTLQDVKEKL